MNLQNRNNLILSLIAETQFDAYVQGYMAKAGAAAGASDNLLVEAEGAAMLQGLVARFALSSVPVDSPCRTPCSKSPTTYCCRRSRNWPSRPMPARST